jgi:hypothetical protein
MNTDALFKELEPPAGGAARFAQRLDEIAATRASPRARVLAAAAAVAAVALVTAVLLRQPDDAPPTLVADASPPVEVYGAPEFDRLLGRSARPAEVVVMVNMEAAAVTEIETTNEKVRIYQIN